MTFVETILQIEKEKNLILDSKVYSLQGLCEEDVLKLYEEKKVEALLKYHRKAFTYVKKGRYAGKVSTYFGTGKERKQIYADTIEALYEKLFQSYGVSFPQKADMNDSLLNLYQGWQKQRKEECVKNNTRLRNDQNFKKFLADEEFMTKSILSIKRIDLQTFCNQLINKNQMTSAQWREVNTLLTAIYSYAMDIEILQDNLMEKVRIHAKFQQSKTYRRDNQTVSKYTREVYFDWLSDLYDETGDTGYLAILFLFYTGLRSGEVVALKWGDVAEDYSCIMVSRMEEKDQLEHKITVVEHTKSYEAREVPLCHEAVKILKELRKVTGKCEYLFMHQGKRVNYWHLERINRKFYEETKFAPRSLHKIRKTFASNMSEQGAPITDISDVLGHRDTKVTTDNYIYSTKSYQNEKLKKFMEYH